MKRIWITIFLMLTVFSLCFGLADHAGWTDPAFVQRQLAALHASPLGMWLAIGSILVLLGGDIILPTPSSIVMIASGKLLGPWLGGTVSFAGAMASALIGYGLCRWGGERVFQRLVGEQDISRLRRWFERYGIYAIILSRPVPMLTEILSCLAGLSAFRLRPYLGAVVLGTLPICFVYSVAGTRSEITDPWPAIWLALALPAAGWLLVRIFTPHPQTEEPPHG